jgi:hypothetical protein
MEQLDICALLRKAADESRVVYIRTGNPVAHLQQHLGQRAHAVAAYPDEMYLLYLRQGHRRSSFRSLFS